MVGVDAFDLESDLPTFLESVLQKAETILQNVEEQNQVDAEVLAEVLDQSISLIQTLQEPGEIQPSNIIALNSLAGAITNVLALLRIHISSIAVTPTTLAASCVTMKRNSNKQPG